VLQGVLRVGKVHLGLRQEAITNVRIYNITVLNAGYNYLRQLTSVVYSYINKKMH